MGLLLSNVKDTILEKVNGRDLLYVEYIYDKVAGHKST